MPSESEVVGESRTESLAAKFEQEKQGAYEAGFRDGYLDQIPIYFRKGDLGIAYANGLKAGEAARIPPEPPPAQGAKEETCSNGSQDGGSAKSSATTPDAPTTSTPTSKTGTETTGTVTAAASTSNPPAWVTPQIIAECKPGETIWGDDRFAWAFNPPRCWDQRRQGLQVRSVFLDPSQFEDKHESYVIPTPHEANRRCLHCGNPTTVDYCGKGCAVAHAGRKPGPDDAEEVADRSCEQIRAAIFQHVSADGYAKIRSIITAAIRADRQKHAGTRAVVANPTPEQAKSLLRVSHNGKIEMLPGYNSIPPDLAGKVRGLCEHLISVAMLGTWTNNTAREVLAMMEAK